MNCLDLLGTVMSEQRRLEAQETAFDSHEYETPLLQFILGS